MLEEEEREGGEKKGYEDRTEGRKSECGYHDRKEQRDSRLDGM